MNKAVSDLVWLAASGVTIGLAVLAFVFAVSMVIYSLSDHYMDRCEVCGAWLEYQIQARTRPAGSAPSLPDPCPKCGAIPSSARPRNVWGRWIKRRVVARIVKADALAKKVAAHNATLESK